MVFFFFFFRLEEIVIYWYYILKSIVSVNIYICSVSLEIYQNKVRKSTPRNIRVKSIINPYWIIYMKRIESGLLLRGLKLMPLPLLRDMSYQWATIPLTFNSCDYLMYKNRDGKKKKKIEFWMIFVLNKNSGWDYGWFFISNPNLLLFFLYKIKFPNPNYDSWSWTIQPDNWDDKLCWFKNRMIFFKNKMIFHHVPTDCQFYL